MVKAVLATLTTIVMASGKLHEAPPCSCMSTKDVKFSLVFRTPMHSRIIESLMVAFHRSYPFFVLGPLFHGKTCKFNGFWSCHTHSVGVIHSLAFDTFIVGVLRWFLHPLLSLVGMYWVMGIECLTVESLLIGSNYVKQYLGVSDSAIWFIGTHSIISKGPQERPLLKSYWKRMLRNASINCWGSGYIDSELNWIDFTAQ